MAVFCWSHLNLVAGYHESPCLNISCMSNSHQDTKGDSQSTQRELCDTFPLQFWPSSGWQVSESEKGPNKFYPTEATNPTLKEEDARNKRDEEKTVTKEPKKLIPNQCDKLYLNKSLSNNSNHWRKTYNQQTAKSIGIMILEKGRTRPHYLHGNPQGR